MSSLCFVLGNLVFASFTQPVTIDEKQHLRISTDTIELQLSQKQGFEVSAVTMTYYEKEATIIASGQVILTRKTDGKPALSIRSHRMRIWLPFGNQPELSLTASSVGRVAKLNAVEFRGRVNMKWEPGAKQVAQYWRYFHGSSNYGHFSQRLSLHPVRLGPRNMLR